MKSSDIVQDFKDHHTMALGTVEEEYRKALEADSVGTSEETQNRIARGSALLAVGGLSVLSFKLTLVGRLARAAVVIQSYIAIILTAIAAHYFGLV